MARRNCTRRTSRRPTVMSHNGPFTYNEIALVECEGDEPVRSKADKPPYQVPSMGEIAAMPLNGMTAVSTFSGCGGGCLGLRMAGFAVVWASEFIPAAADTYRANFPGTRLDTRDIRQVDPAEILDACGLARGEVDLLEGSPPCSSFSTAGKMSRHWSEARPYSDTVQRTDDLFAQYARILAGLQPRMFVAENVSGLVKGVSKGFFKEILAMLADAGYRVRARLLDASWLGVPQARQRIFFAGVRADLGLDPEFPKPLAWRYTVRDALGAARIASQRGPGKPVRELGPDDPAFSVAAHGMSNAGPHQTAIVADAGPNFSARQYEGAMPTITNRDDDFKVVHDTGGQFSHGEMTDRPAYTVPMGPDAADSAHFRVVQENDRRRPAGEVTGTPAQTIRAGPGGASTAAMRDLKVPHNPTGHPNYSRGDVTDHPAATAVASDDSDFAVMGPPGDDQPVTDPETGEDISLGKYAISTEWARMRPGQGSPRYLNLKRQHEDHPSQTVSAKGGVPGAAGVTHYAQARKLTLGELRALSGFPHDFILTGTYRQRWERIGRAVPPVMMWHMAMAIAATLRQAG